MEESDTDSSVERMFIKYSKKFKEDFTSKSISKELDCSSNINININMPSTSGATSVSVRLKSGSPNIERKKAIVKKSLKRGKKKPKRKRWIDTNARDSVNSSDPDYVPTRSYEKMTSKELNNIAARVRIFHETGVIVSDTEDTTPYPTNSKKKKAGPQLLLDKTIRKDHFGKGEIGKAWSSYKARQCACCNLRTDKCVSNLPSNTPQRAANIAVSAELSNHDYSDVMQRLSHGAVNRFKKREGRLLQLQQQQLLKHPELADLIDLNDSLDVEPIPPPAVLSHDKRQWIQRFIDSMTPDRIDYDKPQQRPIVQGITHTPPKESDNFLQQVLDKHADFLDTKTIVQRVDFEKEKERRSRLIQTKLDSHFKSINMATASTPNLDQATGLLQAHDVLDAGDLSPIRKEGLPTAPSLDISGIAAIEAEASIAASNVISKEPVVVMRADVATTSEIVNNIQLNDNHPTTSDYVPEGACARFSHLDRSNVTIRAHKSRPTGLDTTTQNGTKTDTQTDGPEDNIMDFVNDLLAEEEEAIRKEVEERCERLLENSRKTRDVLFNAVNEYIVVDDIFDNQPEGLLDNSVQIIEEPGPLFPSNNDSVQLIDNNGVRTEMTDISDDVLVVDGPSTSRTTRSARNNRRAVGATKRKGTKRKAVNLSEPTVASVDLTSPIVGPKMEDMEKNGAGQESSRSLRDCPICMEPFSSREISSTICGHVFCTTCIVAAVKAQRSCPNCRKALTLKKIHPLFI